MGASLASIFSPHESMNSGLTPPEELNSHEKQQASSEWRKEMTQAYHVGGGGHAVR